jgi:diguanylate cyclase (GGDEF)-like protein
MHGCEQPVEPEHAPHVPIALFDADGRLHGWSPAFADDCAQSSIEFRDRLVGDFWPEFGAGRWAEIWHKTQSDGSATVVHVLARSKLCDQSEIVELEIGRFMGQGILLAKIEIRRAAARRLSLMQQEILETMANGVPLKGIMETLCRRAEALAPSVICSVLGVNRDQQLCHIASPSLPQHYSKAIDGLLIGPMAGSCGTAAFRGEPVEVIDIANDPLWQNYKHLALPLGLRACWSSPIKAADGRVLGAFAFYFPLPRGPTSLERQIVSTCLSLCTIALEHEETRSRAYERAFTDPLTHLANRARFQKRVGETMAIVAETGQRIAVQYIGLDRFQAVNEMLGYAVGDELLKTVAARLQSVVKDHDAVARIGGDEFALIQVGDLKDEDVADRAADHRAHRSAVPCMRPALGARRQHRHRAGSRRRQ